MINQFSQIIGVIGFLALFGWALWLCWRVRKVEKLERENHAHEIQKEYLKRINAFKSNDLDTRVKLSNERLGLRDSKPKGDKRR